ncbi:MAG TPA: deoxyribodipyrimidine photo-lyase [Puia sp.]|jgi:deoxyribodipyrimidine photo-lyase
MKPSVNIFWIRRDLRLYDNAGFYHALKADLPVLPVFIFDRNILDRLENKKDARVEFIHRALGVLIKELARHHSTLEIYYGKPSDVFTSLTEKYSIVKVFTNEDYEPYARERDAEIEKMLHEKNISFHSYKDQVIFSKQEVLKEDGRPYTVFTPYSNKWKSMLTRGRGDYLNAYPSGKYLKNLFRQEIVRLPDLSVIGFANAGQTFPMPVVDRDLISSYDKRRDYPGLDATTHLGIHLRFGTISIRQLATEALMLNPVFLNELIWRDFYQMILWQFPKVGKGHAFKEAYENIKWRNNEQEFSRWCEGLTGYPLVDAGMRQLNQTGFMHNRIRMVTASFLSKHLLIDWRWGEAYFAEKLLDFDLASNNGGWQWAAGSGCDAAPYFRVFNPTLQQEKFDPGGSYVKKWLPDLQELSYPEPIVEHSFARDRAIRVYKEGLTGDR